MTQNSHGSTFRDLQARESGQSTRVAITHNALRQHAMKLAVDEVFGGIVYVSLRGPFSSSTVHLTYDHRSTYGGRREPDGTGMLLTWGEEPANNMKLTIKRPGLAAFQFARQVCIDNPETFHLSMDSDDGTNMTLKRIDRVARTAEDWAALFFKAAAEEMIWIIFRHSFVVNALAEYTGRIHINPSYLQDNIKPMSEFEDVESMKLIVSRVVDRGRECIALDFKADYAHNLHSVLIQPFNLTTMLEGVSTRIQQILDKCFEKSPTPNNCTYQLLSGGGLKMRFQRKSDIDAIVDIVLAILS